MYQGLTIFAICQLIWWRMVEANESEWFASHFGVLSRPSQVSARCRQLRERWHRKGKTISKLYAGLYPKDGPYKTYVDVTSIPELHSVVVDGGHILIGGGVTISQFETIMEGVFANDQEGFFYGPIVAEFMRSKARQLSFRSRLMLLA